MQTDIDADAACCETQLTLWLKVYLWVTYNYRPAADFMFSSQRRVDCDTSDEDVDRKRANVLDHGQRMME